MSVITDNTIVFTRNLYLKSSIPYTLEQALTVKKDLKESISWAYELYFSGFEHEVLTFVSKIMVPFYFKKTCPQLVRYAEKKYKEWKTEEPVDSILASIIKNIIYVFNNPNAKRFLSLKDEEYRKIIENFEPGSHQPRSQPCRENPRKYLSSKCLYMITYKHSAVDSELQDISDQRYDELLSAFRENWLYYAWGCPLWETRIRKYGGYICQDTKTVAFNTEEDEEAFYEEFGYEPDEQNYTIYEKCLGIKYFRD